MLKDILPLLQIVRHSQLLAEQGLILANDNDTTLPTSAAVKDYVDTQITAEDLDNDTTQIKDYVDTQITLLI